MMDVIPDKKLSKNWCMDQGGAHQISRTEGDLRKHTSAERKQREAESEHVFDISTISIHARQRVALCSYHDTSKRWPQMMHYFSRSHSRLNQLRGMDDAPSLLCPDGGGADSEALHIATWVNAAAIQGTDIKQSTNWEKVAVQELTFQGSIMVRRGAFIWNHRSGSGLLLCFPI